MKVVRIKPASSPHKEKYLLFLFLILYICKMMDIH